MQYRGTDFTHTPVTGIPSTTNRGSLLALIERFPLIKIEGVSPGAS
jgi:hypothetical protein